MAKTITCSATVPAGGCEHSVTADSMEGAMDQFGAHAKEAHADMMAAATEEDMQKWKDNFATLWANTPDDAPAAA